MKVKRAQAVWSAIIGVLSVASVLVLLSVWGHGATVVRAEASDVYGTYYVAPDCDGVPEPCYTTVQGAVDAVDEPTDVIKVATGRYTGVSTREGVAQVVYISKTLALQGGYTTAFVEPPDPVANAAILDAEGEGRVVYITEGVSPTIRGLHITGGDADGLGGGRWVGEDAGGGVYAVGSSLVVSDCSVFSNTARSGGGLLLWGIDAVLNDNSITTNTASTTEAGSYGDGGGLLILSSTVTMSRNLVRYNNAGFSGSGMYLESESEAILTNNVIADNVVDTDLDSFDCGIYIGSSSLSMLHTTIARNEGGEGTGVCVDTSATTSTAVLTNTIIVDHVTGIDVAAGSQAVLRFTLWQGNATNSVGTVTRTDDRAGNPAFAEDGYHLTGQSAAIDEGVDTGLSHDIDGQLRPDGAAADIGADEYRTDHYADVAGLCNGFKPCHPSIGSAVSSSRAGDRIFVFPGTYSESVDLSTMAIPGDIELFTVDAAGTPTPGTVSVDPGAAGGPGTGQAFYHSAVPFPGDVVINGFEVDSPDADGIWLTVNGDVEIAHVRAISVGNGIGADGSGDDGADLTAQTGSITLTNSVFNGSFGKRGDGVDIQGAGGNVTIIDCSGNGNQGTEDNQGFEIEDVAGDLVISGTEALHNDDDGFWIWDIDGAVAVDGTIVGENGCDGLYLEGSGPVTIRDSHARDNGWDGFGLLQIGPVSISQSISAGNVCDGFWIDDANGDVMVRGTRAVSNGCDGFAMEWVGGVSISQCMALSNTLDGFWVENAGGDLSVSDSTSSWNKEDGFDVESDGAVTFARVDVLENGWDGLWVWKTGGRVEIVDTEVSRNLGEGVYVNADGTITVTRSTANLNDRPGEMSSGFVLFSGEDLLIQSCTANSNSDDGYTLFVAGQMTISDSVALENVREGVYVGTLGFGTHQVVGNVFCENGFNGINLDTARSVAAEGDWWGNASGPEHPTNPAGTGDGVEDSQNGGAGTVDFTPWIDTLTGEASVDPAIAGQPTVLSFGISGQAGAFTLGPGPGDPNGSPPFTVTTDDGLLSDADEMGLEVHGFIGEPNGVLTVTLWPSAAGSATVTLDGPCGLDVATAVQVLPCNAPESVIAATPPTVTLGRQAAFTASISPPDAHLPVTFTWEATGQGRQVHAGTGISDTQAYTWFVVGRQTMTVTAVNLCGSAGAVIPLTVTNVAPVADAGPGQLVLVGERVTLDGGGSFDPDGHVPLEYGWEQTGGTSVTLDDGDAVSTTFAAPSTPAVLTFTLIVTDAYGLPSAPDETVVAVGDSPIVGLEAANSAPTTVGRPTRFTATIASGANVAYTWAFGDGEVGARRTTSHAYGSAAVFTAVVTATNAASEVSATTLVTITNLAPVAYAGLDQGVLAGQPVTLDGSGSYDPDGHNPLAYSWRQTGGPTVTLGQDASVSATLTAPDGPTVLSFSLTVTDAYGLASSPDETLVTVGDVPITGLVAENSSPTVLGQPTLFSATVATGGDVTYQWAFGDDNHRLGQVVSHTYSAAGTYTAVVTATNGAGGVSTTTVVTVTNLAPVATAGLDQEVLTGETVTIDGSGSYDPDGHEPLLYRWAQTSGPAVAIENAGAVSTTFTAPQLPVVLTFTLTVTDAFGLASSPNTVEVTVGDVPIADLEAFNSSPTTLGEPTWFTATIAAGGNVTYQWDFDDGETGVGRTISHTYGVAGMHTAVVTASNATGQLSAPTVVRVEEGARLIFLPLVVKSGSAASDADRAVSDGRRSQVYAVPSGPCRRF